MASDGALAKKEQRVAHMLVENTTPLTSADPHSWPVDLPEVHIPTRLHHEAHLLLWQARGSTTMVIDGEELQLTVGQAVWMPAGARHELTVHANSVLLPLFFRASEVVTRLTDVTVVRVGNELQTLLFAYLQWQNTIIRPNVDIRQQLITFLERSPVVNAQLPMPISEPAARLAEALRRNPGDSRTCEELAASIHASPSTIVRAFRNETGMTFGQWRTRNRMAAAAEFLRQGMRIALVATSVGYLNASAFGRAFKEHSGMTPREYVHVYGANL